MIPNAFVLVLCNEVVARPDVGVKAISLSSTMLVGQHKITIKSLLAHIQFSPSSNSPSQLQPPDVKLVQLLRATDFDFTTKEAVEMPHRLLLSNQLLHLYHYKSLTIDQCWTVTNDMLRHKEEWLSKKIVGIEWKRYNGV